MSSHITACSPSHYEALDPTLKEIRVLEKAPASGDDIIECTMKRTSLLDDPVPIYETISYCWELPRAPSTIKLNGHLTPVPASSEAALKRMRLSDRPRVLWIDAICIDQSSVTERSAQVAFMSTVYRAARHNLVYLGEDDGMADRGVKAIQYLVNDMRTATADLTLLFQTIYDRVTGAHLHSNEAFGADVDFEALEALFSLHWFRRLWVLQEAVLAQSNTCHWGTSKLDLLDTVRAARWLLHKFRFISQGLYDCVGWRCAIEMFDFLDPDNGYETNCRFLFDMLEISRQFEKTEPKDSIYAVLGLLDHGTSLEGVRAALLEVDYTKSLADILRDATRYALRQTCDLKALHGIDHRFDELANSQTFPTWAIRADLLRQAQGINRLPTFFRACEGLEAPSSLGDVYFNENVLLVEGIVADEVLQTTITSLDDVWEKYEEHYEWLVSVKNMAMHHCDIAMQEDPHLAIAFTLVAGETHSRKQAQPDDLQVLVKYIKGLTMRKDGVISDDTSIKPRVDKESMATMYAASRLSCCRGRRFFVTAAGRMGIGPRCMRPEDIIVILRGGITPFILRKKVDGYWLLGEAYVHGVMYGEAVQIERSRGGSEVVFPVR